MSDGARLHLVPVRSREAREFVGAWHRHHPPPAGQIFAVGAADEMGTLRAVAIVGRPVARHLDDGATLEVTRTASDGTRNTNSLLYGASWRATKALGYRRLITFTQEGESGASLRGAGWRVIASRPPRAGWHTPSRPGPATETTTLPAPCGKPPDRAWFQQCDGPTNLTLPRTAHAPGVTLHAVDLTEHTRLLGKVAPTLMELSAEATRIRKGEIAKPFREIAPLSLRVHELAMRCTWQVHDLSISQYPAMKDGAVNLAHLAGACAQISLAATLCTLAVHHRTEILLSDNADSTPATSRDQLRRAVAEMQKAASTYGAVAQQLSRRLASPAARDEDQRLIADTQRPGSQQVPSTPPVPSPRRRV